MTPFVERKKLTKHRTTEEYSKQKEAQQKLEIYISK